MSCLTISYSRAWCKTVITTSFYIRRYNSFAPSPRIVHKVFDNVTSPRKLVLSKLINCMIPSNKLSMTFRKLTLTFQRDITRKKWKKLNPRKHSWTSLSHQRAVQKSPQPQPNQSKMRKKTRQLCRRLISSEELRFIGWREKLCQQRWRRLLWYA